MTDEPSGAILKAMSGKTRNHLAEVLRSLRASKGVPLRALQEKTGVSNAYLSQLETGKAREPSPTVLHKLASFYGVDFNYLMRAAGYPTAPEAEENGFGGSFRKTFEGLSRPEREEVKKYIEQFVLPRRKKA